MSGSKGEASDVVLFDTDEQRALEACRRVRADLLTGEERLRRTLEAGRLLRAVDRRPGARTDLIKPLDEVTR